MKISGDVIWTEVDGEVVILNTASGVYFSVGGVGTRIWSLIVEQLASEEIITRLLSEFEVEETQLKEDFNSIVSDLATEGLVDLSQ
jgi:hypothetical protein